MNWVKTDDFQGMGTTIEALVIIENNVLFAHIGDSRISLIHDGVYAID